MGRGWGVDDARRELFLIRATARGMKIGRNHANGDSYPAEEE